MRRLPNGQRLVLPRPAWRRDRDLEREAVDTAARESHRQYATLEDLLGAGPGPVGPGLYGLHLLRAALTLLLPDECDGQAQPIRITQIKQRMGVLTIGFYEARTDRVRCAGAPTPAGTPIAEPDCGDLHCGASSAATNPPRRRDCSRSAAAPARRARWLHAYRVRPRLRRR